jgi:death-on-curing protein
VKEPVWIEESDVYAIHERVLVVHGGAAGIRDRSLLQSALARPHQHYAYADRAGIIELGALYTAGIVRNHPFVDGNKRTGFVIGVLFLELNGYKFTASEEDATEAVLGLAAGTMSEHAFTPWMGENAKPLRQTRPR